jgi:hypothetical protein
MDDNKFADHDHIVGLLGWLGLIILAIISVLL